MKHIIIVVLALLLAIVGVWALPSVPEMTCQLDETPLINFRDPITWVCKFQNTTAQAFCNGIMRDQDGRIISLTPKEEHIQGIGTIDKFESQNGLVHVFWESGIFSELRHNISVEATVFCIIGDDDVRFTKNITPLFAPAINIADRTIWFKENFIFFFGAGILLSIVIAILVFSWKGFLKEAIWGR